MKLVTSYKDLMRYKRYRASLHNHTFKAGIPTASPKIALGVYRQCKIPIVAITDHDRRIRGGDIPWRKRDWEHNYHDAVLIEGFEASFPQDHVNILGLAFDEVPKQPTEQGFVDWIYEKGGYMVLNHPVKWNQTPEHVLRDPELSRVKAIEVYNGGLATKSDPLNAEASELWDHCLTAGIKMFALANSDCHEYDFTKHSSPLGAWNVLWLERLSRPEIFAALNEGRFYATSGVELDEIRIGEDQISLTAKQAEKITFIGNGGKVLLQVDGTKAEYTACGSEGYIRIELEGTFEGRRAKAWLQPIWIVD